jgi:hypothetical protein
VDVWPVDGAPYALVEEKYPTGLPMPWDEMALIRRPREGDYILGPTDMAYGFWAIRWVLPPDWAGVDAYDGQWVAHRPHERVQHDGYEVPLYAPDPEREAFYADERRILAQRRWRWLHAGRSSGVCIICGGYGDVWVNWHPTPVRCGHWDGTGR